MAEHRQKSNRTVEAHTQGTPCFRKGILPPLENFAKSICSSKKRVKPPFRPSALKRKTFLAPLAFLEKVYPSALRFFLKFSEVAHKKGALSLTYSPCGRAPTVLGGTVSFL